MKTLTKQLLLALALLSLCDQSNAQKRIQPDSGSEENESKRPRSEAAEAPSEADSSSQPMGTDSDIDAQDYEGTTALIYVTRFNRLDNVQELITARANVNLADNNGVTPLINAASNGNVAILQALIAANANVNQADKKGITPLMYATFFNGNVAILQALIAAGADVNQADKKGVTALMYAARGRKVELLQGLLNAGADVTAVDNAGLLAIDWGRKNEGTIFDLARERNKGVEGAIKAILEAKFEEKQRELLDAVADEWQSCPLELIQGPINEFLFGQK